MDQEVDTKKIRWCVRESQQHQTKRSSRKKTENSGKEMIQEVKQFIPELKGMNFQVQMSQCPAQWVKDGSRGGTIWSWNHTARDKEKILKAVRDIKKSPEIRLSLGFAEAMLGTRIQLFKILGENYFQFRIL